MPAETLAEIIEGWRTLECDRSAAASAHDYSAGVATEGALVDYYIANGPRLVAVCEAAVKLDFDGAHCMNADIDHECYEFSPEEIQPLRSALASPAPGAGKEGE